MSEDWAGVTLTRKRKGNGRRDNDDGTLSLEDTGGRRASYTDWCLSGAGVDLGDGPMFSMKQCGDIVPRC